MSWQEYVDRHLVGTGKVSRAAIIGLQGGVWAHSSGYTLFPEEQSTIIQAFKDPSIIQTNGFKLAGVKFIAINPGVEVIQGKKQQDGAVLAKTNQAILVTEYVAPTQAQEATTVVTGLQDYLKRAHY